MKTAIRLENLRKDYELGGEVVRALRGISLDVPEGDYVAIMGPSGSGKSTLLNVLGCLDRPTSGHFVLGDEDISQLDDDRLAAIRASHVGFVFQSYNLIPQLNVSENIETPLYYGRHMTAQDRKRCRKLAEEVGLGDRLKHRPLQLSGGQQQRAAIARSLANNPRFILADEPTGNLDSVTTQEILDLLDRLNAAGKTIIMVTHEEPVAKRARRIVRLMDGAIQSDARHRPVEDKSEESDDPTASSHAGGKGLAFTGVLRLLLRTLRLGVKSLWLHPLRSLLTVLGIFIGVASVIWLLAIGEGISAKAQEQIAELGARNILLTSSRPPMDPDVRRSVPFGVTRTDCQRLQRTIPSIRRIAPIRELVRREFRYRDRVMLGRLVGCTPAYEELYRLEIARGHFLADPELDQARKVCVIADGTAQELFPLDDPVGKSIHIDADYYRVIGVTKGRLPSTRIQGSVGSQDFSQDVYVPITTVWARVGDFYSRTEEGEPLTTRATIQVRKQSQVLATAEVVRRCMDDWHEAEDYLIVVPLELLEQARSTRLMFIVLMGLIAAISLVVGGIGIMNIMLATVTERTREIGIRRAMGARRSDISRQFLVETVVLSIVGGVTGILGGLSCRPLFEGARSLLESAFPEMMETMPAALQDVTPIIVPWSMPLALGISMAVGVMFGLYPATRAAAMDPIEALRHVG